MNDRLQKVFKDPKFWAKDEKIRQEIIDILDPNYKGLTPNLKKEVSGGFLGLAKAVVGNVPKSGARFIEDIITPFLHPVDTANALYSLGAGIVEKTIIPGKQENEYLVEQMADYFKGRYGNVDSFKKTIAEDPVGTVADVASIVSGIGGAVRGAGALSAVSKLSKAGKAISKVGGAMEPLNIAKSTLNVGRRFIPKPFPGKMYQSAVKFSTALDEGQRAMLTNTALKHGIMPTINGLEKVRDTINTINDKITAHIDELTESGNKIPLDRLFADFATLEKEASLSGSPVSAQKAIKRVRAEIVEANIKAGRTYLSPKQSQTLKQNIYHELDSWYSKTTERPVKVKAKMSVARAAKESIETIFPEVKQLNQKEGALLDLREALDKPVSRIRNRDLLGLGAALKSGIGGAAGGSLTGDIVGTGIGATAGLIISVFDDPIVKAKLSIVLNKLVENGIKISPNSGFVKLGLYQSGKISEETSNIKMEK